MEKFTVLFYETRTGRKPAEEFLLDLEPKMMAKMARVIQLLAVNGSNCGNHTLKELGDKIFELRAKVGSDISRVLYFFAVGKLIILINGFIKKTQKTPNREIERAKVYRKDYLERLDRK